MKLVASIAVVIVGFGATITAPAGPPLLLAVTILAAGALALATTLTAGMP